MFIKAVLKPFPFAVVMLEYSGPDVVVFQALGKTLFWLLLIVFSHWLLGI